MNIFTSLDWFVLLVFFGILGYIIYWVINQKQDTSEEYFLAGRNLGWFVIGASIFASNIGRIALDWPSCTSCGGGLVGARQRPTACW